MLYLAKLDKHLSKYFGLNPNTKSLSELIGNFHLKYSQEIDKSIIISDILYSCTYSKFLLSMMRLARVNRLKLDCSCLLCLCIFILKTTHFVPRACCQWLRGWSFHESDFFKKKDHFFGQKISKILCLAFYFISIYYIESDY